MILHSRDIRKCEGPFQIFFDLSLKHAFYADLDAAMERANFTIIAAAINKEEHIKRYGKLAHDPYDVSLSRQSSLSAAWNHMRKFLLGRTALSSPLPERTMSFQLSANLPMCLRT